MRKQHRGDQEAYNATDPKSRTPIAKRGIGGFGGGAESQRSMKVPECTYIYSDSNGVSTVMCDRKETRGNIGRSAGCLRNGKLENRMKDFFPDDSTVEEF